ncbi:gamma-glutamyltransferase [Teredinibacter waterburyi]|uniref:gamma-glutamyltransferase n=1 Tax=Teredinibacter waterburyi TaxID=1500538 RepID=UPI001FEA4C29|nr:gamma-glutamyltransferase [Teredinibacter waterburyi]
MGCFGVTAGSIRFAAAATRIALTAAALSISTLLSGCTGPSSEPPSPEATLGVYSSPPVNDLANNAMLTPDGRGAIASVNSIATEAGLAAFAKGGNAIDAALAVAFTLGVVDGFNSGLGGGCFIVARTAAGELLAIDGREMAPALAHANMFNPSGATDLQLSRTGALAIGVPGSVAALELLHQKGGKLNWSDSLLPAARLAEQGFVIDELYAKRLAGKASDLARFDASAEIFLDDGQPLPQGSVLRQLDLAKTYRALAQAGSDYFYQGEFAAAIDAWMKANGGLVRASDFKGYKVLLREPVVSEYNGFEVVGFPPPSSGGTAVSQLLNVLQAFDLKTMSEVDRYHVIIEAMKLVFADRAYWMGDPDFVDVPKGLLDKHYADSLAAKIDPQQAAKDVRAGTPPNAKTDLFNRHTTHITVADAEGNWVTITTTLNTPFGSKVAIPGTGVVMNNQMDDFNTRPNTGNAFDLITYDANRVEPFKRPLSSMSPTLVFKKGEPVMALGAAGGPTIITQVAQVLVNSLALGMDLPAAMAAPRVHHQWRPDRTLIDPFTSPDLRAGLDKKGHNLVDWPPFGATQAIEKTATGFVAVSEPRLVWRIEAN